MTESEPGAPVQRTPKFWFSRLAVLLILVAWVYAGVTKVKSIDEFLGVIELHGVIAPEYRMLGMVLPMVELLLALLLVFVLGSELRKAFGRTVLIMSASLVAFFVVYLSFVPDEVLQESGCGCWGKDGMPIPVASGMDNSVRIGSLITTGTLLFLHAFALVGPVLTMRRRARSDG
ncbi:MAG: MauE/DoxX family redox-associated membrane protein [Planctomycetota bacterium]